MLLTCVEQSYLNQHETCMRLIEDMAINPSNEDLKQSFDYNHEICMDTLIWMTALQKKLDNEIDDEEDLDSDYVPDSDEDSDSD